MYVCTTYVCIYICVYVYIYIYIHICVCMYVSIYVLCICTYIYMCHCKQNRTQSFCLNQWISKQLHVLPPLSTTYVTALKCRLFWHCQNSHYLLSSFPFMFSLLFLLLSWKHFFLSRLSVSLSFFLSPFFLHIFLSFFIPSQCTFRFYCQHSFIHYFLLFPFFYILPSCTHTYVHNTQIQIVDLTITKWCTSLSIKKHRIPRCVEVPNLTKWWKYLINHNYNNQALFRLCFLF